MIKKWIKKLTGFFQIKYDEIKDIKFEGETFFTSDLRFDHEGVIHQQNRPYKSVEQMNADIIKIWNNTVSPYDRVYILGGFGLSHHKVSQARLDSLMDKWEKLNGEKYLIAGRHDGTKFRMMLHKKRQHSLGPRRIVKVDNLRLLLTHKQDLSQTKSFETYQKYDYHLHGCNQDDFEYSTAWDIWGKPVKLTEIIN